MSRRPPGRHRHVRGRAQGPGPARRDGHQDVAVARSGLIMASGTATSRVLGLVRVALLGGIIGTTGLTADAFQVANTLPNQFYLILAGGILNAVLVPQIIKADTHEDGGEAFINRLITLALALLTVVTILTTAAAPWLVRLYFDTTNPQALALSTTFAYVCLPRSSSTGSTPCWDRCSPRAAGSRHTCGRPSSPTSSPSAAWSPSSSCGCPARPRRRSGRRS